jgi:hypothetical protein
VRDLHHQVLASGWFTDGRAAALAMVWGEHPPFLYFLQNPAVIDYPTLNFYKKTGAVRARYAEFLIDGSMLVNVC